MPARDTDSHTARQGGKISATPKTNSLKIRDEKLRVSCNSFS